MTTIKRNVERLRRDIGEVNQLPMIAKAQAAERLIVQMSVILDQIGDELERHAAILATIEVDR